MNAGYGGAPGSTQLDRTSLEVLFHPSRSLPPTLKGCWRSQGSSSARPFALKPQLQQQQQRSGVTIAASPWRPRQTGVMVAASTWRPRQPSSEGTNATDQTSTALAARSRGPAWEMVRQPCFFENGRRPADCRLPSTTTSRRCRDQPRS